LKQAVESLQTWEDQEGGYGKLANWIPTAKSAESHRGVNPMSWKRAWAEQPLFHYSTVPTSRFPPFHSSGS